MATRINLMKMLQEVRGMAELTNRNPLVREPEPAILPVRSPVRPRTAKQRRIVRIWMKSPPDIPTPVKITYLTPERRAKASAST